MIWPSYGSFLPNAGRGMACVAGLTPITTQDWRPPETPSHESLGRYTIELKVRALEKCESERRSFLPARSPDALRAVARRWGSVVGTQCAEAFQLIRSVQRLDG